MAPAASARIEPFSALSVTWPWLAPACTFLTVMLPEVVLTEMSLPVASVPEVTLVSARLPLPVMRVSPLATEVVRPPSRLPLLSR